MTNIQTSTLRPGLLVSLKTSIVGNVRYAKQTIEAEYLTDDGAQEARWETQRTIADPVEHEAAKKARARARSLITGVCANSAFGLICPEIDAPNLDAAVAEARKIADEFNATAKLSRVYVYVITGRIAPDDVEAVKAINSEIRDLLSDMESGISRMDVKAIREAASRAKSMGAMLSPTAAARVQIAIETARSTAKKIVAAGEGAAQEVDAVAMRKLAETRTAFLDLDPAKEIATPATEGRAVDLMPSAPIKSAAASAPAFEME